MHIDGLRAMKNVKLFFGRPQLAVLPLSSMVIDEPFKQWDLDFISPLNPPSSVGHTHILTATNYFMKLVEVVPIWKTTSEIICNFLKENILTRFGVPWKIVNLMPQNFPPKY